MQLQLARSPRSRIGSVRVEESSAWLRSEDRQLQRMLKVGFAFFLVRCALLRLFHWKGSAGPGRRRSIVAEAREAAGTYIPMSFGGW